jgi:hypothetical protein
MDSIIAVILAMCFVALVVFGYAKIEHRGLRIQLGRARAPAGKISTKLTSPAGMFAKIGLDVSPSEGRKVSSELVDGVQRE